MKPSEYINFTTVWLFVCFVIIIYSIISNLRKSSKTELPKYNAPNPPKKIGCEGWCQYCDDKICVEPQNKQSSLN